MSAEKLLRTIYHHLLKGYGVLAEQKGSHLRIDNGDEFVNVTVAPYEDTFIIRVNNKHNITNIIYKDIEQVTEAIVELLK